MLSKLLGQGHFAMTIDRGSDTERYQGVVPLEGESLTEAADTYFRQSEQLPTYIRLAVAKHYRAGHPSGRPWTWRAGGLLVQKLTREGGHGPSVGGFEEEDWMRARALAETVEDHELLDPLLPPDRLLYRLFHEEQVRAYRAIGLETYCSCSRERVEELLRRFTSEDLKDMVVDGEVWVTCEFCNSRYRFDPASFTTVRRVGLAALRYIARTRPRFARHTPLAGRDDAAAAQSLHPSPQGGWRGCPRSRVGCPMRSARSASLARNAMQASSCATVTNSSAAWACAMSPGPQITVGQPASSNSPASVAVGHRARAVCAR